ncbi:PTS sugar transporter subunit IIC [Clostridium butyricum]|uniref:PTS transporter subunit EIIC n=1 Tax=Clostridium butyricum TaxID=1492 RepID=UPI000F526234|nr:PTS transporter subunit EIIC [Clostridium butyricum]RQN01616.1 PTS sugar transporter subunit IIC [Clostridium butyricum]
MSLNQTLNEKVVPVVMKFVNLKGVQALKDGMLYTLPLNIIGSMFLLVAAFPLKSFTDFCASTFGPNWNDPLYKVQNGTMSIMASDSPFGAVIIAFFVPFLWFFGIHGVVTVGGMVGSLLTPNTADNALLQAAGTLDLAHGAHIVTQQFYDNFINLAGSGQTLGLTMAMLFLAKSAQYKQLGRLAITPNLFNINEPILFGTPIVLNPIMGVPFIIVPVVNALLLYFAIATELLPPMGGQLPPWTVPPVLSGLIIGGWKYAVMQFVVIALGGLIYLPFFKKIDAMAYADEIAAKNAHTDAGVQA